MYHRVWNSFNKFLIRLNKPDNWEDRVLLFSAYLIQNGNQSSTVKSYVSAIKSVLKDDGYTWNENAVILGSLTRACRVLNDIVTNRFPIRIGLLELILFEVERLWDGQQPYLEILYKAMLILGYYGLLRIGELTKSNHVLKAKDIHVGINKQKILILLHTSKTHNTGSKPQEIKITSLNASARKRHFCPFQIMRQYMKVRGGYSSLSEQLFVFKSGVPLGPSHIHTILKKCLSNLNINSNNYNVHSLRIGMASDMYKRGFTIEQIKQAGRWKSNAVYKYLK